MKRKFFIKSITLLILIAFVIILCPVSWAFTLQDEIRVGREAAKKVERRYKVLKTPEYQGRVTWLASLLYRVCPRKDIPYTFKVLDCNIFNAFALPGGFIYVNKGLMDRCSDGEIAFVLGHEMAHCAHSHQFKQAEKNLGTSLGILALVLILSKGKMSQGAANTAALANAVFTSSYSRADERQADIDSLSYMSGAGIDPQYAVSAFEKMKKLGSRMPDFMNTLVGSHPPPDERINYVRHRISELGFHPPENPPVPPYGSRTKSYYLESLKRGEKPPGTTKRTKTGKQTTFTQRPVQKIKPKPKPVPQIPPEKVFVSYRAVPFGNLTKEDLAQGEFLPEVENEIYEFLKQSLPGEMKKSSRLNNYARSLTFKQTRREVTRNYVIYSDIVNYKLDIYGDFLDFKNGFMKYDLPKIKALGRSYNQVGVSAKDLVDGRKYIVIILK